MKNNYNFIAPYYDFFARLVFGKSIQYSQLAFISKIPEGSKVLFIGGGSGNTLKNILQQKPQLQITYLEKSTKMLELSKKKVGKAKNIIFTTQDLKEIPLGEFDVVLSFFFFDIFDLSTQEKLFKQVHEKLKPHGLWFISDFQPPKKEIHKGIEKLMFIFLKLTTSIASNCINDYQKPFNRFNYQKLCSKEFYGKFIFASLYKKAAL